MYKCENQFYFRYPILPLNSLNSINSNGFNDDCLSIYHNQAKEILASLSADLSNTIKDGYIEEKAMNALYKYINRASFRTTPYGLAAGVGKGEFKKEDYCNINALFKYARADMEWVSKIVRECELTIGCNLVVKKNNTIEQIGELLFQNWNDCFMDQAIINKNIQIRTTRYVDFIMGLCEYPTSIQNLINESMKIYPNVEIKKFESVINLLIEKEYLISDLRVNSSCIDPFKNLIECISNRYSNKKSQLFDQLMVIDKKIEKYNSEKFTISDSDIKLNDIKQLMSSIKKSNNYLQIDLYSKENIYLDRGIKSDIEEFANFIAMCTFQENNFVFIDRFLEKYGHQRVKFLDVLKDKDFSKIQSDKSDSIFYNDKLNLILLSILEEKHNDSIDLYKYKDRFSFEHKTELNLSDSMELAFYITKSKSKHELIVTPLGGSRHINNIMGRFKYLYDIEDDKNLAYSISFVPNNPHVFGVIQSILPDDNHIYYGGFDQNGLDINDVYIGIKNNKICFYSKKLKQEINVINNNMVTSETIPEPLKKMLELSNESKAYPVSFLECIYHIVYNFPGIHFPEIRFKNIVIVPESWRFNDNNISKDSFKSYFKTLCQKNKLPEVIIAGTGDNKLYLSTVKETDIMILYDLYKKDHNIVLFKAMMNEENLIINDSDNKKHVGEFVFELQEKTNQELSRYGDFPIVDKSFFAESDIVESKKGLFENWIYLKIYITSSLQTKCLLLFFETFYPKLIKGKLVYNFFFIRYRDPNDHLRIRINSRNFLEVLPIIQQFINELKNKNYLTAYTLEQYVPEIYRYGGINCIESAERFFQQDSICALSLLQYINLKKSKFSLKQIFIISSANIMNSAGLSAEMQNNYLSQYRFNTKKSDEYKIEFEPLKNIITSQNYELNTEELIMLQMIFDERREALEKYWEKVLEYNSNANTRLNVMLSILHMHFNRLFGVNRGLEQRLMGYLRKLINEWYSYEKYKEKKMQ